MFFAYARGYGSSGDEAAMAMWVMIAIVSFIAFMVWLVWYFSKEGGYYHFYHMCRSISTLNALRIYGRVEERIIKGHWSMWSQSLWRSYELDYFLFTIDEINAPRYRYMHKRDAEAWVKQHAPPDHAKDLVKEWFGEPIPEVHNSLF